LDGVQFSYIERLEYGKHLPSSPHWTFHTVDRSVRAEAYLSSLSEPEAFPTKIFYPDDQCSSYQLIDRADAINYQISLYWIN